MNVNDLIRNDIDSSVLNKYINYYFYEMIKLKPNKEIFYSGFDKGFISIMKDEVDRKEKGSGKLRDKPWSNFLFYFVDRKDFEQVFGTNERHRDITKIDTSGNTSLTPYEFNYTSKKPQGLYSHRKNNIKFARYIFEKIKNDKSFLFVRSYVYITIVLYNNEDAGTSDFLTFYFNTNYKFTETNGKKNFIANVNNSYLVEDLVHEISNIEDNNRDIFDCVKAYNDTLEYTNLTSSNIDNIVDAIEDGNEYLLVEGSARTGKTIIAMSLLRKYEKANLLVMNYYFYLALKDAFEALNTNFPSNRIFHQSYGKAGYYDGSTEMNFDFSIIDECQRLGLKFDLVDRMTSSPSHITSIFFSEFAFYQLYVLMTRATMSLNLFFEGEDLKSKFKKRLLEIINFSSTIDNNIENCVKVGQFEVNEAILEEFKMKYNIETPQEKIKERNITRLVHFTEEKNIPNIIKNGLLPRKTLDDNKIIYDFNDKDRLDGYPEAICLSVENPNQFLLEKFKRNCPNKKYKLITIDPSNLYSSYVNDEEIKLVHRVYCNYNAASKSKKTSDDNIDIMFSEKVQTYHWIYGDYVSRTHTRDGRNKNEPTCTQAEILFFGRISPEFIDSIEDI